MKKIKSLKNKLENLSINEKKTILVISLIMAFTVVFISLIFNDSLWGDEAYTMLMIKKSFPDIIRATASDVHPPLYYFIAKIFTLIFGYKVFSVKLASLLPVILSMIFVFKKSNKLFMKNRYLISILFILLIGFCPVAFKTNIGLRMYTWAMFFVTCSGIYAYQFYSCNDKKELFLFILFSLLAAYTHYYAALTVCFVYLFLMIALLKKSYKNYIICIKMIIYTIIGYLPWLPIFFQQFTKTTNNWWLNDFPADIIQEFMKYLFSGEFTYFFLILIFIIFIELISNVYNKRKDKELVFALCSILPFILTILFGYAVSRLIRPLFLSRYMYPGAGLFFLGISIAIVKSDYKKLLCESIISLIMLNFVFSYNTAYVNEYKSGTEDFKKFVSENITSNDKISTDISHFSWTILPYYIPDNNISSTFDSNTSGYVFTYKNLETMKKLYLQKNIELVFSGNIDFKYNFSVYYIE